MGYDRLKLVQGLVGSGLPGLQGVHLFQESKPLFSLGGGETFHPAGEQPGFLFFIASALLKGGDISCKGFSQVVDKAHADDTVHVHIPEFFFPGQEQSHQGGAPAVVRNALLPSRFCKAMSGVGLQHRCGG